MQFKIFLKDLASVLFSSSTDSGVWEASGTPAPERFANEETLTGHSVTLQNLIASVT